MSLFLSRQSKFISSTVVLFMGWQSVAIASSVSSQVNRESISQNDLLPALLAQNTEPLFPDPKITIDGEPVNPRRQPAVPPFQRRAVAPPVGDMSVSNIEIINQPVNLGTNAVVPRLVLRDAPLDEVLKILARAANRSIMFDYGRPQGEQATTVSPLKQLITIDLEGERVQDIFNNLLRLNRLESYLEGNTIFVGENLPYSATGAITRTLRVNQGAAGTLASQLALIGATVQEVIELFETDTDDAGRIIRRTFAGREIRPLTANTDRNAAVETPLPLQKLNVTADDRTNSITLTGTPQQVQIATNFIVQSDVRLRQVAVNVKIIDVLLDGANSLGSSFSFGIDNTGVVQDGGAGVINFGSNRPSGTNFNPDPDGNIRDRAFVTPGLNFGLPRNFLAQIRASVTSGNAKVLSDPTLIVQEGQTGVVELTQGVLTSITTEIDVESGVRTITPVIEDAGLKLSVNVDRVDDNGFVSIVVDPEITSLGNSQTFADGLGGNNIITFLNRRSVSSGLIRLRDGQSLVLSGIIQDTERVNTTKVPILGDLPLLGSLFRSTRTVNQRNEVLVLLTPTILDDSEAYSGMGYRYTPSPEVGEMLRDRGVELPTNPF